MAAEKQQIEAARDGLAYDFMECLLVDGISQHSVRTKRERDGLSDCRSALYSDNAPRRPIRPINPGKVLLILTNGRNPPAVKLESRTAQGRLLPSGQTGRAGLGALEEGRQDFNSGYMLFLRKTGFTQTV